MCTGFKKCNYRIEGISDTQILSLVAAGPDWSYGAVDFGGSRKTVSLAGPVYRDKHWNLWSSAPRFLSANTIVMPTYGPEGEGVVQVLGNDGTILSQHPIPKLADYNIIGPIVAVSMDGQYFALRSAYENRIGYWWNEEMDMCCAGSDYWISVYNVGTSRPVRRIKVGARGARWRSRVTDRLA